MDTLSLLFLLLHPLTCLDGAFSGPVSYGVTLPESPIVEIGKNFTAMCVLYEEAGSTADDIYWMSGRNITVPKEQYTKVNDSAVNVTITITRKTPDWLTCKSTRLRSPVHGIILTKGYRPEKPTDLSCMAVQLGRRISPNLSCSWDPGSTEHEFMIPVYTLTVIPVDTNQFYSVKAQKNGGSVDLGTYPSHLKLNISVEAENRLAKVKSDYLEVEANDIVKTNPPSGVRLIPEKGFSRSLRVEWKHPIDGVYLKLKYNIRFCAAVSGKWTEVPQRDTENYMESFRLQDLRPDTDYVVQVRCICHWGCDYWSDWSPNATARTPEAKPTRKPDLWRIINRVEGKSERRVQVISKAPVESNGEIREYSIKFQDGDWQTVTVNHTDLDTESPEREITVFPQIVLSEKKGGYFEVIARNGAGESPKAWLYIPKMTQDLPDVGSLDTSSQEGRLWMEWQSAPNLTSIPGLGQRLYNLTEYVVEWVRVSDGQMDWQRESRHCRRASIRGNIEKFRLYNISVYPVYSGTIGKPLTKAAFLEEGVPLEGVSNLRQRRIGKYDAELEWSEIPLDKQRGFITHYTIYYSTLNNTHSQTHTIKVSPDTYSYTLKSLSSHTKVVVRVGASTVKGEMNSTDLSFITRKYAPGEIEGIVVGVCLTFLFSVVLTMLVCICKKNCIKKIIWPDVPDPSNSTIATWSPDFPSKPDTPKESALADVSVVEVDVFDGKSLFEEDKACLPLKKDKYLSEEHSSGIGGSSCMSSPRQSVSDSDEGGDSGQTTASTVQYSSVVASGGYKGQTPGPLPAAASQTPPPPPQQQPAFARSESTQPLLDSEEHPEGQEGGGGQPQQRYPRNPYFRRSTGGGGGGGDPDGRRDAELEMEMEEQGGGVALLRFSPLEEGSQQTTPTEEGRSPDGQSAAAGPAPSGYRPQLSGYRPQ